MNSLETAREQLNAAVDLPGLLSAAYTCFTVLISVIEQQHDPRNPLFVPFLLAGASAASGRFALAAAPSLPASARAPDPMPCPDEDLGAGEAALGIGQLAEILDGRLRNAGPTAVDSADRQACADAARHAAELSARLGRTPRS